MQTYLLNHDFILLIVNCKKYRDKSIKQKNTWLKNFTLMPYFHIIGDLDLETDFMFDHTNKTLYVKVEDDYNSLPKKVIAAYNAIYKSYNFKYIFKTDDDQILTNSNFFNTLQTILLNKLPKIHYGGHIVNVEKSYLSQYHKIHPELPKNLPVLKTKYCSGRFYILSDLAVADLISKKETIEKEYLEDYSIGYNLDSNLKTNILHIQTNKYFIDIQE